MSNESNEISFEDIFRIVAEEMHGGSPVSQEINPPMAMMPVAESAIQAEDLERILVNAEKHVNARDGLLGKAIAKLRGNELDRVQYDQMVSVIKANGIRTQGDIAQLLIVSLMVFGHKAMVAGVAEMEQFGSRYDPNSAAGQMARSLLADNTTALRQLSTTVNSNGAKRILKVTGLG